MYLNGIFLVFALLSAHYGNINADCQLDIKIDHKYEAYKRPLFLNEQYEIWPPSPVTENGKLIWKNGDKTIISCPGKNNTIKNYNIQQMIISCEKHIFFRDENKRLVEIDDLRCTEEIDTYFRLVNDEKKCPGNFAEIGFETDNHMSKILDICYEDKNSSSGLATIYSYYKIHGEIIEYTNIAGSDNNVLKDDGGFDEVNELYKEQERRFRIILQHNNIDKYFLNKSLIPAYLNPVNYSTFTTWQKTSFYYANTAPQWDIINKGNIRYINGNFAKVKAKKLKDDLEVYTGTHGILHLEGKEITLGPNGYLPVPKFFWIILKYKNDGIAFVTSNNPFEKEQPPCTNLCIPNNRNPWCTYLFEYPTQGFTFVCEVSDLLFYEIPPEAQVDYLLSF